MSEDTKLQPPKSSRGAGWTLFLLCVVVVGIGLALDLSRAPAPSFWFGTLPGARALIGAGAALAAMLVARLLRIGLARREETEHARDRV